MGPAAARALLPAALLTLALNPGPAAALPCGADCPAGTFVVSAACGRGAGAACRQCPSDTFSSAAGLSSCTLCRKCEGRFRYLKECSSKSDAECTCKEGYRCSGNGCSRCDRSCGVGEENTGSGCQSCRYGTFNDQLNGSCKNWTKCSANQVLEPGTAAKDVICKLASDNPTLVTTLPTMSPAIPFSITVPVLQTYPEADLETNLSANSRAVEFCSLTLLRERCLLPREGPPDGHYQNFSYCSWAVVHSVSATFVRVLQYLAEKETTCCLQENAYHT